MNLQKMMQQAQQMQQKITDMQAKMDAQEVEGKAGGGMIAITINGKHRMLKVNIDQSLLKADEKEVLEDLIVAAYNDAKGKLDTMMSDQMSELTGGLNLPPGLKLPF